MVIQFQALQWLNDEKTTSVELTQTSLKQMERMEPLNAFITKSSEVALAQARKSDQKRQNGEKLGLLEGIPLAVKDIFCTSGIRTTCASRVLKDFIPGYDSTVASKLKKNGAVLLGKTNMDEFAMGSGNLHSHFGAAINPWSTATSGLRVAGGSSGGSAAAVSSLSCYGALGTDTGGSVRLPAAYCGVYGFKPSYGRISRYGMISYASSLDTAGVLTRSVRDAAVVLDSISGEDVQDSTCLRLAPTDLLSSFPSPSSSSPQLSLRGMRIGIPRVCHCSFVLPFEFMRTQKFDQLTLCCSLIKGILRRRTIRRGVGFVGERD
eukprot:TRINITY_DN600_c0_g1_i4.p1 TRINITY_DN600_c0_g1~~TRINITY_DN600_c0_g1_i4.p1  ORF type:complete len:321 (-),score=48.15 TRINITY_DN600_c0_g1_i4:91-1053(-)